MKLTTTQIEILVSLFFKTPDAPPGAPEIARLLLADGSCIVAGTGRIWNGGVGNFTRPMPAEGAVGCTQLTFDREALLSSLWAVEHLESQLHELRDSVAALEEKAYAVADLLSLAGRLRAANEAPEE
jgi:hypothetical protein